MLRLRTFGSPVVEAVEGPVGGTAAQRRSLALLALLASSGERGLSRDKLLGYLWPEVDAARAAHRLRQLLHALRRDLQADALFLGWADLRLNPQVITADTIEFNRALDQGELARALALYQGPFLDGFYLTGAAEFERCVEGERARLHATALEAAWTLSAHLERGGNADDAAYWARWAFSLAPEDERALRRLIALLGRLGDRPSAIRVYQEFAERLQRDYELTPSAETQQLIRSVRAIDSAPTPAGSTGRGVRWDGLRGTSAGEPLRSGTDTRRYIAIFPFSVHGRAEVAYLAEGLVDLLSTNFDHAGMVTSVDPHALLSLVRREAAGRLDPDLAQRLASSLGADLYVLGNVVGVAGRLRISAALYRRGSSAPPPRHTSVDGPADQIFELVDGLTAKLLSELHTEPGTRLLRLAATTTPSLPALKAYLAGESDVRAGRLTRAAEALGEAVRMDPEFALAWYRLAFLLAAPASPHQHLAQEAAEQALRRKEKLSGRDQTLLEALYASIRGAAQDAERLYREILAVHPEDVEAWMGLGHVLAFHSLPQGRLTTDSRAAFERVLALDPGNATTILPLAYVAGLEGKLEELEMLVGKLPPDSDQLIFPQTVLAFWRGDSAAQRRAISSLRVAPDLVVYEAARFVAVLSHDFVSARTVAQLLAEPARQADLHGVFHILAAFLDLAGGRRSSANRELTAAELEQPFAALEYQGLLATLPFLPIAPAELERRRTALREWDPGAVPRIAHAIPVFDLHRDAHAVLRLYLLGAISARLDDPAALKHATDLDAITGTPDAEALARDLAHSVRAQWASWRGDHTAALSALNQARMSPRRILVVSQSPFYTQTAERWLRAELLQRLGRDDDALRWYASIAQDSLYDLIYLAPSHLRRGEIHEQLGNRQHAAAHYSRFVELWRNCDRELRSIVTDVECRLERLQGAAAGRRAGR